MSDPCNNIDGPAPDTHHGHWAPTHTGLHPLHFLPLRIKKWLAVIGCGGTGIGGAYIAIDSQTPRITPHDWWSWATPTPVPEPSMWLLFALAVVLIFALRKNCAKP